MRKKKRISSVVVRRAAGEAVQKDQAKSRNPRLRAAA
jgi:hypothetical protein